MSRYYTSTTGVQAGQWIQHRFNVCCTYLSLLSPVIITFTLLLIILSSNWRLQEREFLSLTLLTSSPNRLSLQPFPALDLIKTAYASSSCFFAIFLLSFMCSSPLLSSVSFIYTIKRWSSSARILTVLVPLRLLVPQERMMMELELLLSSRY